MSSVIYAEGLRKRYGRVVAVDGIDLRVAPGEIYAFLGLNGAGKTTTIRMLLGMVRPSNGVVSLFGEPVRAGGRGPWRRVGHLVEAPTAYPELTVRENLEVARRLGRVADRTAVARSIERFGLAPNADRRAAALSSGNRQRLALARALLHGPELVILDEPTNALDPAGVVEVRELLRGLARADGVTVFISSHVLAEMDRLATRVGIIHEGRLLEELDAAALERGRARRLVLRTRDPQRALEALAAAGFSPALDSKRGTVLLTEPRALANPDIVAVDLVAAGVPPVHLAIEHEDLEQYFLRLTRGTEPVPAP